MARNILRTGEAETTRVEAFSDGVLAIVITLLVLELKVPQHVEGGEAALWHTLAERMPMLGAWIVSFLFVLVFWVAHHYFFKSLTHVDRGLLWLNGLFLLTVSFTPFPTALAGEYPSSRPAVFVLSVAMFLTATAFWLMRWYATTHAQLIRPELREAGRRALRRGLTAPALYMIAIVAALVWTPLAMAMQALVPLVFFFPGASAEEKDRAPGEEPR
jgi:uncharacterized membrane protein